MHEAPRIDRSPHGRHRWTVFAVLFALMVVDYIDRQIVASMFPLLKAQWRVTDAQLAALVSIVSFTVAAGTVPLSFLADRFGRAKSIVAMAMVWSFATIACGFAEHYAQLLGARAVVGFGEAAYGSVGAALLATLFPARMRSTIVGSFLAAAIIGSVVGVALGGVMTERWGWQAAFGVAGVPGVILAIMLMVLVADSALPKTDKGAIADDVMSMLRVPRTLVLACLGGGLQLVIVSVVYAWMPAYLGRFYGLSVQQAGLQAAFIILVGAIGVVCGSIAADRLSSYTSRARLYVPAAVALASFAIFSVAFAALQPGKLQLALIVTGAMIMAGSIGPLAAVVIDVTIPRFHATSASLLAVTQNLFGLTLGPLVVGLLSDRYGLPFALSVVPICTLVAAVIFFIAARGYDADVRKVSGSRAPHDEPAGALA